MKKSIILITILMAVLLLVVMVPCDRATAEGECEASVEITNIVLPTPITPGVTLPQDIELKVTVSYDLCGLGDKVEASVQARDSSDNIVAYLFESPQVEITGSGSIVLQDWENYWGAPVPANTAYLEVSANVLNSYGPYHNIYPIDIVDMPVGPGPSVLTASFTMSPDTPSNTDTITFTNTSICTGCNIVELKWYLDGQYLSDKGNVEQWSLVKPELGSHKVKLIVRDDTGRNAEAEKIFAVQGVEIYIEDVKEGDPEFPSAEIVEENGWAVPCTKGMRLLGSKYSIRTGLETEVKIAIREYPSERPVVEIVQKEMMTISIEWYITALHGTRGLVCKTDIKVGELDVKVDPKLKNVDWSVSSPSADCGVRGTHFIVQYQDNSSQTTCTVLEGVVEIQSITTNETIEATPGQRAIVHPDSPIEVFYLSESEIESILENSWLTNNPPTASFSIMPENPQSGDPIVIASTSSDPDGDILTYSWYVDGNYLDEVGSSASWEWTDAAEGNHTIELVVEDSNGGTDEFSETITVGGAKGFPWIWVAIVIGSVIVVAVVVVVISLSMFKRKP